MGVYATINISFEFVALLLAIAGSICMLTFPHVSKQEKYDLALIMASLGVSALFNGLFNVFNDMGLESSRAMIIASRFIGIMAGCLCIAFLNLYLIHLIKSDSKFYKVWTIIVFAIQGVVLALLVGNLFAGYLYSVNANNHYVRGITFYLIPVVELVLWLAIAALVVINRKSLCEQDMVTFYIYFSLLLIGLILQCLIPQLFFVDAITIMSIVVLLFGEQSKATDILLKERIAKEEAKLETEKTRERLFRSQVSPHFIYNALTAIQALPDNPDKTKKAIGDFAKYLRHTLNTINKNTLMSFEQEFENVQVYLRLEKIRFGKSLQVEYDIQEKDFDLPAMSVQILAENAVKHGISVKREGGTIKIATRREDNDIVIRIIDNGVGFEVNEPRDSNHIGIENVRNRVETMVNGKLEIESKIGYGTTATIRFPISE